MKCTKNITVLKNCSFNSCSIKLTTPVRLAGNVQKINLPRASSNVPIGSNILVSGYGMVVEGGKTSPVLRKVTLQVSQCGGGFLQNTVFCGKRGKTYGVCPVSYLKSLWYHRN